ncbi:MAG TPA: endonuclease/exonuclease/phosphatase family protein [Acidimicrobiia bacterium]
MGLSARSVGRLLLVPTWALVIGLLTIAVAHVVAFDHARVFMLADSYTLWIYLPAYAIAVAAICFRARTLGICAAVLIVAHLAWVLPPAFRRVSIPASAWAAPRLRVVSANLNFDNREHGPLLAELARDDADVVVLEELTPEWWKAVEASGLWSSHPYRVGRPRTDPGGMAVLSREPLREVVVHDADGWPIITAAIVVDGTTVHLTGVHLLAPLDTFNRNQRQQRAITAIIRALPRPRVVAGDFNADPYNRWYEQILGLGFREAHEAVGRSLATTWPNGQHHLPPLRLDHVFVDPPIVPLRATEGRGTGSDHRPIVVDLAITRSVAAGR